MTVSITCYGGAGEIGGNKILLEDGKVRLLLDFGIPFGRQERFFNEYLRPRTARGLLDLMCLGLIPPLEGIYGADLAGPGLWERFRQAPLYRDLQRRDGPALNAVLISHAHLDHNGDVSYLDPDIPVCTTRITAFVARAMQISGQSGFERELTYVSPREWDDSEGVLRSVKGAPYRARAHIFLDGPLSAAASEWWETSPAKKPLLPAAPVTLNDCMAGPLLRPAFLAGLQVRYWPVDHSVPGAAAFAIRTSAGWIGYTGDIRFHGQSTAAMERFAQELADLEPVALLCEGTHLGDAAAPPRSDGAPITEEQVASNALRLARRAAGKLVVADFSPRNVERLLTFLEVAQETGRLLAIQPKDAFLLQAMSLAAPPRSDGATPSPSARPWLSAFAAPPRSDGVDPLSMPAVVLYADPKSAPRAWEKDVREEWAHRTVGPAQVCAHPGDYVLCFSLWDANDLLDLEGIAGGVYFYSNSRAYDEEQAVDLQRLRNWVQHVGLRMEGDPEDPQHELLHASGHATGPQLRDFVRRVHPRILIPVHTEHPEWWLEALTGADITVAPPEMGRQISIEG